jgi:hypothetical protein
VQYPADEDLAHLQDTLCQHCQRTVDKEASKFCGMTLERNSVDEHVNISMPGYIQNALQRFTHLSQRGHSTLPLLERHQHVAPKYNIPTVLTPPCLWMPNHWHPLVLCQGHRQHYACGPRDIGSSPTQGKVHTMDAGIQLLNYAATHLDVTVRFHTSDVRLYNPQ